MTEWIAFEEREPEDETAHYWLGRYDCAPSGPHDFAGVRARRGRFSHYSVIPCPRDETDRKNRYRNLPVVEDGKQNTHTTRTFQGL